MEEAPSLRPQTRSSSADTGRIAGWSWRSSIRTPARVAAAAAVVDALASARVSFALPCGSRRRMLAGRPGRPSARRALVDERCPHVRGESLCSQPSAPPHSRAVDAHTDTCTRRPMAGRGAVRVPEALLGLFVLLLIL